MARQTACADAPDYMPGYAVEILIVPLLIPPTDVLAVAELAILTARKTRLEQWSSSVDGRPRIVLDLASNPNQLRSPVKVGILG
jgi:putative hemolysin